MGAGNDLCTDNLTSLLGCVALISACRGIDHGISKRLLQVRLRLVLDNLLSRGACKPPLARLRVDNEKLARLVLEVINALSPDVESANELVEKLIDTVRRAVTEKFGEISKCEPSPELLDLLTNPIVNDAERFKRLSGVLEKLLESGAASLAVVPRSDNVIISAPGYPDIRSVIEALRVKRDELEKVLGRDILEKLEAIIAAAAQGKRAEEPKKVERKPMPRDLVIEVKMMGTQPYIAVGGRRVVDWNQMITVLMEAASAQGLSISYDVARCIRDSVYRVVKEGKERSLRLEELIAQCSGG